MNTNPYAPFKAQIDGLFRERLGSAMADGLAVAPQHTSAGGLGIEWLISTLDGRLSAHDIVAEVGIDQDHQRIEQGEGSVHVKMVRYDAGYIPISQRLIDAFASQNDVDIVETRLDTLIRRLHDKHVASVYSVATGEDPGSGAIPAATSATLDLTNDNAKIVDYVRTLVAEICRASGLKERELRSGERGRLVFACGQAAYNRIFGLDEMFEGSGVAIGSSTTAQRRLGAVEQEALEARFRALTGVEIVPFDNTLANGDYIWGDNGLVAVAAPRGLPGCLKTFTQAEDPFRSEVRPAAGAQVAGVNVLADGFWRVATADQQLGRRFAITVPS